MYANPLLNSSQTYYSLTKQKTQNLYKQKTIKTKKPITKHLSILYAKSSGAGVQEGRRPHDTTMSQYSPIISPLVGGHIRSIVQKHKQTTTGYAMTHFDQADSLFKIVAKGFMNVSEIDDLHYDNDDNIFNIIKSTENENVILKGINDGITNGFNQVGTKINTNIQSNDTYINL